MTRPHKLGALVTAVVLALATNVASGDPTSTVIPMPAGTSHIQTPSTMTTDGGSVLRLPPGYWMDEPTYKHQDDDLKILQDTDTRLTAENKSLRVSVSGWQPGWKVVLGAVVTGLAAGIYIGRKL